MLQTPFLDPAKLPQHAVVLLGKAAGSCLSPHSYVELCETASELGVPVLTFSGPSEACEEVGRALQQTSFPNLEIRLRSESGRDALVRVARQMATMVRLGTLRPGSIDAAAIEYRLGNAPPPDLVICPGDRWNHGGMLVWELSYSELYRLEPEAWELGRAHLLEALFAFQKRDRRFGKVETISKAV